jgi:endoribonuclease Dicer
MQGYEVVKYIIYDLDVVLHPASFIILSGHIGEDFAADLQDGLLTSKVHFLIKSLLEYR